MPKKFLRKYLPNPKQIRELPALRPLGKWLQEPELWHLHRRSVSGAVFIGMFCAFMPIPFQMVVAASLAVFSRCNLPISVALVWITNPSEQFLSTTLPVGCDVALERGAGPRGVCPVSGYNRRGSKDSQLR